MTERPDEPDQPDQSDQSDTRPDDAMDTGSDAGAPGDHLPEGPLDGDDLETLAVMLESDPDAESGRRDAVEDSPAVESAVEDDSPLRELADGGDNRDGLDARFVEPEPQSE